MRMSFRTVRTFAAAIALGALIVMLVGSGTVAADDESIGAARETASGVDDSGGDKTASEDADSKSAAAAGDTEKPDPSCPFVEEADDVPVARTTTDTADDAKPNTKRATVAGLSLSGSLDETTGSLGLFVEVGSSLPVMISRLDRAADDSKVSAILLTVSDASIGRGKLTELRAAIARVRAGGKKVYAKLTTASTPDYLVAAACDSIVMPESGSLMIPGVRAEVTFYKGLFDKLGIEADMMQVGAFKGAAEPYTRDGMSPEFRKQYEGLLDDIYAQMVETIAADRHLAPERVRELIDIGMFSAAEAKEAGLIDMVAYDDQLDSHFRESLAADKVDLVHDYGKKSVDTDFSGMTGMLKLLDLFGGGQPTRPASTKNKKIALVYAVGTIMSGESSISLFGGETLGSDTIVKALRQARDDESVAAIVLRVDSPGGSALASDLIWREIAQIDKPVIASMGDVAASGGYYISMGCDRIFAEPGTLTGSIGVVGGKIALGGLYEKIGLKTDIISRGRNSGLLSGEDRFTDSEREVWKRQLEETYRQFTTKAAEGRHLEPERLETLAGGRVWTGRQAKENGLVDELGTLSDAMKHAKTAAGLKEDDKVETLILPTPKSFFDQLLGSAEGQGDPLVGGGLVDGASIGGAMIEPKLARLLGEAEILRRLFAEPSVLVLPYHVNIR